MSRDLPVIGNRVDSTLHSQYCGNMNQQWINLPGIPGREPKRPREAGSQSNRLDTDSSAAVRPIASPISDAISRIRMLPAAWISFVG
jgi:hypothetical protein